MKSILGQCSAFGAQLLAVVSLAAVKSNHVGHYLLLLLYPALILVFLCHLFVGAKVVKVS